MEQYVPHTIIRGVYMTEANVRQIMATISDKIPQEKMLYLKSKLAEAPDEKADEILCAQLHNPTHMLLFSIFLGGLGAMIDGKLMEWNKQITVKNFAYRDEFITHGSVEVLQAEYGVDYEEIERYILEKSL